ncbi:hypothetical protein [Haladaptatus halobius]|uniref:hypothetical protein n=1 Tax=Haladaptatus halobius TaxID=2884875 RepID=UPI001D0B6169|nr:hypothetical protein [Haladaptatus halobius]
MRRCREADDDPTGAQSVKERGGHASTLFAETSIYLKKVPEVSELRLDERAPVSRDRNVGKSSQSGFGTDLGEQHTDEREAFEANDFAGSEVVEQLLRSTTTEI